MWSSGNTENLSKGQDLTPHSLKSLKCLEFNAEKSPFHHNYVKEQNKTELNEANI